jgi:formamidopyrimidine-DNA glycosylase
MPELPEVETIARDLRRLLVGRHVRNVAISGKPLRMCRPVDGGELERAAKGARVEQVTRRAKYLILRMSSEYVLLVHLGMSGRLAVEPAASPRPRHTHVSLSLDREEELRFVDPRRFGSFLAYPASALEDSDELSVLGPDPLDASFTASALLASLRATHGCDIKAFLLDQRRVAGIGNIYASEALFLAGIHPRARANRLGAARAARLHEAIQKVLAAAIANRGTSFRDYVDAAGERGDNQRQLQVFQRTGQPCPVCGNRLKRLTQQGRSTFYCPRCQR